MTRPEPEPFDPATDCREIPAPCAGNVCALRCHERYLNDETQPNDAWADAENAASWRRFYEANPGTEQAMKAACDPQTYRPLT